ncbi:MAG TPA: ABC transporter ATP-binding protein [Bdellovibrionota bacterium]|jgi:ABC-2 type transport system ATP-binding protein
MSDQTAIRFSGLGKVYKEGLWRGSKPALKDVSFDVMQGQIFGFLGANGAGKTTSIKIALGLQSATKGKVEIFGIDSSDARSRARVGFLPERPYYHLNLNAQEFLNFHRSIRSAHDFGKKLPGNQDLLKLVGIPDVGSRLLRNFSKGMLQRVGLAQALISDPDLVILDEPMSGLDPVGRREVRNLLVDLNRAGKTIFFSSHILSDIESICQRIAFLEKGELKYCGKIDDLLESHSREYEILYREGGKMLRMNVSGKNEAKAAVEKLWSRGAEVESFGPVHHSLEDVLFGEKGAR